MCGRMRRFFKTVLPGILKPLHVLWNELIGFFFVAFAAIVGLNFGRSWMQYKGDEGELFRLVLMGGFFLILAFYAWQSYRKARKIQRS